MPDPAEDHPSTPVSSPYLGPHVVGQRVVVRRRLRGETGPSGAEATTDLLGTCLAWDADSLLVAPDAGGDNVRIALADVVSGKPVPPRASVLARVSAREAERHCLAMFGHVETEPLGEWVLRSDPAPVGRPLKRANSALAMGSPGVGLDEAADRVAAWYAERERPALVQVERGSEVEDALRAAGWEVVEGGDAEFRAASLSQVRRARRGLGGDRAVLTPSALLEPSPGRGGVARAEAVVADAGGRLGEGRAVLAEDWLGLHGLKVRVEHRRQGLGGDVLDALLEWGAERGARFVWLHVESDNDPARALYERCGLEVHHGTRYLRRPDAAGPARG
ncbi:GNAT family N-acetyltransferase [Nocardioides sp. GY 10127]|uniref:GNAT family N-acetyltransferase n=1 Tax=Nocardioides sp. GY 10127 TaxID=2569762 RepID=UPI0010A8AA4F|nr:GNAT family N-acetyltransferase [Nocardioides sp. GY 10127]TIC81671.1 GNAT family N-acetyltransferase [Nocardioides sp. GY 10127]